MDQSNGFRIAIEGCIGSGKTTTARLLAAALQVDCVEEKSDRHPFLEAFYSDVPKFALETELAFVLIHFHQLRHLSRSTRCVSDFTIEKDVLFAQMNLADADAGIFTSLYNSLYERMAPPTLTIVLQVPGTALMQRIKRRGRPFETNMPSAYIERLQEAYFKEGPRLWPTHRWLDVQDGETPESVAARACLICAESGMEVTR